MSNGEWDEDTEPDRAGVDSQPNITRSADSPIPPNHVDIDAPSVARITQRWGPLALAKARALADGDTDSASYEELGPFAWLMSHRSHTGVNWSFHVWTGNGFATLSDEAMLAAVLADAQPDLSTCTDELMKTFEYFGPAKIVMNQRDVEELREAHWGKDSGADPAALHLLEPPHWEGRSFVFCANKPWDSLLVRVVVDAETYAVREQNLGRGAYESPPIGRAYDDGGEARVPALIEASVAAFAFTIPLPSSLSSNGRLARAWREAARAEHASIAAFSRASLELLAVGAPVDLVRRTHEAALDEVEHARLAFSIAAALDGRSLTAGALAALAPREASLARVAMDTLLEAAVPETIAAAEAREAARRAACPALRAALEKIAADEGRHAQLAWDVVRWCARDASARAALLACVLTPPREVHGLREDGWGLLPDEERLTLAARVVGELQPRLAAL